MQQRVRLHSEYTNEKHSKNKSIVEEIRKNDKRVVENLSLGRKIDNTSIQSPYLQKFSLAPVGYRSQIKKYNKRFILK